MDNSIQVLSSIVSKLPVGVVNSGDATPEITIENVLSLIFDKLSVARITKVYVVSLITKPGVPVIKPVLAKDKPLGKEPLIS
jgi:hypothetical protein